MMAGTFAFKGCRWRRPSLGWGETQPQPKASQHREEPQGGRAGSSDDQHSGGDGREHQEQAGFVLRRRHLNAAGAMAQLAVSSGRLAQMGRKRHYADQAARHAGENVPTYPGAAILPRGRERRGRATSQIADQISIAPIFGANAEIDLLTLVVGRFVDSLLPIHPFLGSKIQPHR